MRVIVATGILVPSIAVNESIEAHKYNLDEGVL